MEITYVGHSVTSSFEILQFVIGYLAGRGVKDKDIYRKSMLVGGANNRRRITLRGNLTPKVLEGLGEELKERYGLSVV